MQKYTITLEEEAEISIREIFQHYIDVADYNVADENIKIIENAINALDTMPNRCPVSEFSQKVRKLVIPKLPYLVFYMVKDFEVVILEVFHAKRDQNILFLKYKNL